MSHLMKTVFDMMRADSEFRGQARDAIAHFGNPILHAVDTDDRIGDVVGLAGEKSTPIYVFVLRRNVVTHGFLLSTEKLSDGAPNGEAMAPIDPNAPVGMVLDFVASSGEMNIFISEYDPDDDLTSTASHLVLS